MKRVSKNVLISMLLGFLCLGKSIQSIQELTKRFANDTEIVIFIDNWLALIALIFLMAGWVVAHWAESLLQKDQIKQVKLLFIAFFLIGCIAIPFYFIFIARNEFLNNAGFTSFYLIASGFLLRYSTFNIEIFSMSEKIFSVSKK